MRKITIYDGATEYTLANGPATGVGNHVGAKELRRVTSGSVQPLPGVRATHAGVRDRGNRLSTFTFSVSVELASQQAADDYYLDYPDSIPWNGEVRFYTDDGATVYKHMDNAAIKSIAIPKVVGVSLTITYTITGSVIEDMPAP